MTSSHTSFSSNKRVEADTIRRTDFFHVFDQRGKKSTKTMCTEKKVSYETKRSWLQQRNTLSTAAFRRIDKARTERPLKMTNDQLTEMLNDEKNLVRDQSWEIQIDHFQLNCTSRIMKRACSRRQLKADRYRMIIVKLINLKNRQLRVEYDHRHVIETMNSFWQYVHFTNETHLNSNKIFAKRVLREQSTRYEAANMQVMSQMKEIKLHFEASISWHHKSSLIFYNDEHDSSLVIIKKSFKSRRSRYQTKETYQQRVLEWKASLSHDSKIKFKSNSMTQIYYTERLLSVYVELIHEARVFHDRRDILQEDNDNSHDTRSKDNVVVRFKAVNWIETLYYSSQSPDLNSSKTAWNMLKQRVKRRQWRTLTELKQVMLNEWDKIIMNEIKSRISEMFRRCKILTENEDAAIKSKW
jgi:hypothetical protein